MKKTIITIMFLILLSNFVTAINEQTIIIKKSGGSTTNLDDIYCKIDGNCSINVLNAIITNTISLNLTNKMTINNAYSGTEAIAQQNMSVYPYQIDAIDWAFGEYVPMIAWGDSNNAYAPTKPRGAIFATDDFTPGGEINLAVRKYENSEVSVNWKFNADNGFMSQCVSYGTAYGSASQICQVPSEGALYYNNKNPYGVPDEKHVFEVNSIKTFTIGLQGINVSKYNANIENNLTVKNRLVVKTDGYIKENIYYDVSSWSNTSLTKGGITQLSKCLDNNWFNVSENTGTTSMYTNFTFVGVESFRNIVYYQKYMGNHDLHIAIWNYNINDWVYMNDISGTEVLNGNYKSIGGSSTDFINSGNVLIGILHPQNGVSSHYENIDCLRLER